MTKEQIAKYMQFTKTKPDARAVAFYILLIFCATAYSAFFDEYRTGMATTSPIGHATLIIASICYNLALFFLLMVSRWVFIFAAPILFYIGAVGHIYSAKLGLPIDMYTAPRFFSNDALAGIVKNTPDAVYIIAMFFIGIAIGLVRFFSTRDNSTVRKGQVFAIILILAAGATRYVGEKYPDHTPMPFAYFGAMQDYTSSFVKSFFIKSDESKQTDVTTENNITTVVIFIEHLSKKYATENMPLTSSEGATIMKYAPEFESAAEELYTITTEGAGSLSDVFKSAKMPVQWINISNIYTAQHPISVTAAKYAGKAYSKSSPLFPNPFLAIDGVDEFLSTKPEGLLVININGLPHDISLRYQQIFEKQMLVDELADERHYKNYTASIDAFISEVMKKLKTRKAVLITVALEKEKQQDSDSPAALLWVSNLYAEKLNAGYTPERKQEYILNAEQIRDAITACAKIKTETNSESINLCK